MVATRAVRERRNIQRHLSLVERALNLARLDERLRETAERSVVEQRSQRTTSKSPDVALRGRLFSRRRLIAVDAVARMIGGMTPRTTT